MRRVVKNVARGGRSVVVKRQGLVGADVWWREDCVGSIFSVLLRVEHILPHFQ